VILQRTKSTQYHRPRQPRPTIVAGSFTAAPRRFRWRENSPWFQGPVVRAACWIESDRIQSWRPDQRL